MQPRQFAVGILAEHRDVSGGGFAAADPAGVVFDVRLIQVPRCEKRGTRLPEVCEGDRFGDVCAGCRFFEDFAHHPVRDRVGTVEFRPQRRVQVILGRMVLHPPRQIRHRLDQQDCSAPLLAFDGDRGP